MFVFIGHLFAHFSLSSSPLFHDGADGGGRAHQVLALRPEQHPPLPRRQGVSLLRGVPGLADHRGHRPRPLQVHRPLHQEAALKQTGQAGKPCCISVTIPQAKR